MDVKRFTAAFEALRPYLNGYLVRLVARPALAQDLVQGTYLKAFEALGRCPDDEPGIRRWVFRIATNAAVDELRRHSSWRETTMEDLRERAESDPAFMQRSGEMVGTPETALIAKQHLAACFSCTLRNFAPHKASALLLREVYGFSLEEIAEWLEASAAQVKNWLQETRAAIDARYGATCALVTKNGVCHQCVELTGFFRAERVDFPHDRSATLEDRFGVLKELRAHGSNAWHRMLFEAIDDEGRISSPHLPTAKASSAKTD
jgi:RNA polymerase sigma-70 factor (ECF subfamily)